LLAGGVLAVSIASYREMRPARFPDPVDFLPDSVWQSLICAHAKCANGNLKKDQRVEKHGQDNGDSELVSIEMHQALARKVTHHTHSEGEHATAISELVLYRHAAPTACYSTTRVPSL
jgi:hypothetical protein